MAAYTGHSDSVRGLCEMPGIGFVSASHDTTLRVWGLNGETLMELVGHTALVYSCAASSSGLIASGMNPIVPQTTHEGLRSYFKPDSARLAVDVCCCGCGCCHCGYWSC